ncbi:MAG TPA: radical SAM protein [Candidatus Omnitrophica bacterium]|nr:radical SAM protein [Candidatus Omnitrophota bacterium]
MQADKYRIDKHKLMYHVPRVNDWLGGKNIYPIYMEVSPSGACNHRCTFCGLDFMGYKNRQLKTELFKERLSEMGKLGLRSIMYAGEGEPFLHQEMAEIARHTKKSGIDVAFTTNGTLMKEETAGKILDVTDWIKVSINAATQETYAKIHRAKDRDFQRVIDNMRKAAELRREMKAACTLGMQMVLLPENKSEAVPLAQIARDIGMDYLVVKPYSQHTQSKTDQYKSIKYDEYQLLSAELKKFNSDHFQVIFRSQTMQKWDAAEHRYERCIALPFWSYIDAGGNVWGCSVYLNDDRFLYGNIYEQTFREIWEGEKRRKSLSWVEGQMDVSCCRVNCRMDEINRYLWELKNPVEHVNFI